MGLKRNSHGNALQRYGFCGTRPLEQILSSLCELYRIWNPGNVESGNDMFALLASWRGVDARYDPSAYMEEPPKDTHSLLPKHVPQTPPGYALVVPTRDTFGIGQD